MSLYFLTYEDVIEIHTDQINLYGGKDGIRDEKLLLSAIAQPQSAFAGEYLHKSIFDKAAAYLFHLCQNHPFIDGNKRVAVASALVFLVMNDCDIDFDQDELEKMVRSVANGEYKKDKIAIFLSNSIMVTKI